MSQTIDVRAHKNALDGSYILILTSNSIEKKAINHIIEKTCSATIGHDTAGCLVGKLSNRFVLHICGESGISKQKSIGLIAKYVFSTPGFPKPALVILAGFCWGNLKIVKSDSVIAATEICALNEKREKIGETQYIPRRSNSSLRLEASLLAELNKNLMPLDINVVSGPLASLEIRYESDEARNTLLEKFPDLYGGEMEAFGIMPSCTLPWVVLKAVSDSGGNDFETSGQDLAANRSAQTIKHLISSLEIDGILPAVTSNSEHDLLADILNGDTVSVDVQNITSGGLNDYLEEVIGDQIEYKLCNYSSELEYGRHFPRIFGDLLLELVQNSIRHGRANKVAVQFLPTKIIFTDDGDQFDPKELTGDKGGARAWQEAVAKYDVQHMITVKFKSQGAYNNVYTFALSKAATLLNQARMNCQVSVIPNTVGLAFGRPKILTFDKKCNALYYESTRVKMMSRRLPIIQELILLAKEGKKIFIACGSTDEVNFYKKEFKDFTGEQVVIFIR